MRPFDHDAIQYRPWHRYLRRWISSARCTSSTKGRPTTAWTSKCHAHRARRPDAGPHQDAEPADARRVRQDVQGRRKVRGARPRGRSTRRSCMPTASATISWIRRPSTRSRSAPEMLGEDREAPGGQPDRAGPEVQRQSDRRAVSAARRAQSQRHRARRAGQHRQRQRHQARHAGDRPRDAGAAVHQRRRESQGPHRDDASSPGRA